MLMSSDSKVNSSNTYMRGGGATISYSCASLLYCMLVVTLIRPTVCLKLVSES